MNRHYLEEQVLDSCGGLVWDTYYPELGSSIGQTCNNLVNDMTWFIINEKTIGKIENIIWNIRSSIRDWVEVLY